MILRCFKKNHGDKNRCLISPSSCQPLWGREGLGVAEIATRPLEVIFSFTPHYCFAEPVVTWEMLGNLGAMCTPQSKLKTYLDCESVLRLSDPHLEHNPLLTQSL